MLNNILIFHFHLLYSEEQKINRNQKAVLEDSKQRATTLLMKTSLIYCNSHYEWTETTSNLKHRYTDVLMELDQIGSQIKAYQKYPLRSFCLFFFYFHYQLPFLHILPPLAIVNCAWYIILYKVPTRENSVPNSESSMKPKFVIQTLLKFKLLSSCCHYCRAMKSILVLVWFLVNEFLNILHYSLIIHLLYS